MAKSKKTAGQGRRSGGGLRKEQISIEYVMIYALVFLVVAVVIGLIFITDFHNTTGTTSYCYITPQLPCEGIVIASNTASSSNNPKAYVVFTNSQGTGLHLATNSFYFYPSPSSTPYPGRCLPANIPSGSVAICNATITAGSSGYQTGAQVNPKFTLSYQICGNNTCSGLNANAPVFNTTGTGTVYVSQDINVPYFYIVTIKSSSINVTIDGVKYLPGANIILFRNTKYSLFGAPPPGYYFGGWAETGGVSISSLSSQSTTFNVISDGTISGSTIAITSTSTSTSSTSTSSTSTSTTSTSSTSSTTSTSTTSTSTTVGTQSTTSVTTTSSTSTSTSSSTSSTTSSTTTAGGGGGGCIAGTDQVLLYSGSTVNASGIAIGEYVKGYDANSNTFMPLRVTLVTTTSTYVMEWLNGGLGVTPYDQPMYIKNSTYTGWIMDPVAIKRGWYLYAPGRGWIEVKNVTFTFGNYPVYNIYTGGINTFIVDGYLSDNQKQ